MGSFEEREGLIYSLKSRHPQLSVFCPSRDETKDSQRVQGEPRGNGGRQWSAGARDRIDRNPIVPARLDQFGPGVGDAGRSGISDKRHRLSRLEPSQQLRYTGADVVRVE